MNSWRPYPLLRLVLPFAAGIITEILTGLRGGFHPWIPIFLSVVLLAALAFPHLFSNFRFRWVTGLLFNLFLLGAGYGIACCHRPTADPDFLGNTPDGVFIVSIAEPPVARPTGCKAIGTARYRHQEGRWVRVYGQVLLYLKSGPGTPMLQFGDHIILHAGFTGITDNSNPNSFNYARYLANRGITHQVFASSFSWRPMKIKPASAVRRLAFRVRDRLLCILRDNHVEGREFAVAGALLLGYVNDLDADLRRDYAATGAMHVLSVSGMHVGIIYIFLEFLLGFLDRHRAGKLLKACILLVFIWFYAMITGLSPCVLRSAAMLSLPILGKALNRNPDMYNIIAASLVFILAVDPFLIQDVGFQLSYLAVTGIIVLYKPIYDLYVTSAWLPDKIWSVVAVSIAAQVATLPITLYTFHQFPNYFMLTNIFVVPLSSLIIYVGILVLVTGAIPVVAAIMAKVLVFLIWSLNTVIHHIEQLPWSAIRGIFISGAEMMVLYFVIAALFLFLTRRRIVFLYLLLASAIVMNLFELEFNVRRLATDRLLLFNIPGEALYMFNSQDKAVLLSGNVNKHEQEAGSPGSDIATATMNALGIRHQRTFRLDIHGRAVVASKSFVPLAVHGNFMQFGNCRIAVLSGPIPKSLVQTFHVDLLILANNPKITISDAVRAFHPGQVVIDGTNSRFRTMKWIEDAASLGVHCHAVTINGAFQKDF